MGRKPGKPGPHVIVGERLRIARMSLGYAGEPLAAYLSDTGISVSAYSMYENGHRLIGVEEAICLKRRYGITLDWLYDGQMTLPFELAQKVLKLQAK